MTRRSTKWCRGMLPPLVLILLAGCVTKSEADARARMAYIAGQQAAMMQMQAQQARGPSVTFVGPVRNPVVKWTEDLTLLQAILDAVYTAPGDPRNILIRRNGQEFQVTPRQLLNGQDVPLQNGDVIELQE